MPDLFPRISRTDVPIEESPVARYIIQPCVASAQTINEVTQLKAPIMPIIGSCTFSTLVMMMVVVMVKMDKVLATRTLLRKGVTMQALVKPWMVST